MNYLEKIENFIFEIPTWKFILILFSIMLFKTGIFYQPNLIIYLEVAKNPFENIFLNDTSKHYFYTSYLGSLIAYTIGATNKIAFFLLHLLCSILFTLLFIKLIFKKFSNNHARISLIIFFIFPVSSTVYYMVGYDSVILFLMIAALYFNKSNLLVFLIGILLGLQHFELSFFASGSLLCALLVLKFLKHECEYSILFPISLIIGVILGKLLLNYIFDYNNMTVLSDRADWYKDALPFLLYTFFFRFYNIIWFSIGIGWFLIIKYYFIDKKNFSFFIPFTGLLLMLPILPDTTRTFSVMSFFLISVFVILNKKLLECVSKRETVYLFLIWVLIPYGWAWQGIARQSHLSYTMGYFMKHFVSWFNKDLIDSSWVWPYFHAF